MQFSENFSTNTKAKSVFIKSLFTGSIPNQVCNSQTSRFFSVPGQKPERPSRRDGGYDCNRWWWHKCRVHWYRGAYHAIVDL